MKKEGRTLLLESKNVSLFFIEQNECITVDIGFDPLCKKRALFKSAPIRYKRPFLQMLLSRSRTAGPAWPAGPPAARSRSLRLGSSGPHQQIESKRRGSGILSIFEHEFPFRLIDFTLQRLRFFILFHDISFMRDSPINSILVLQSFQTT